MGRGVEIFGDLNEILDDWKDLEGREERGRIWRDVFIFLGWLNFCFGLVDCNNRITFIKVKIILEWFEKLDLDRDFGKENFEVFFAEISFTLGYYCN